MGERDFRHPREPLATSISATRKQARRSRFNSTGSSQLRETCARPRLYTSCECEDERSRKLPVGITIAAAVIQRPNASGEKSGCGKPLLIIAQLTQQPGFDQQGMSPIPIPSSAPLAGHQQSR